MRGGQEVHTTRGTDFERKRGKTKRTYQRQEGIDSEVIKKRRGHGERVSVSIGEEKIRK